MEKIVFKLPNLKPLYKKEAGRIFKENNDNFFKRLPKDKPVFNAEQINRIFNNNIKRNDINE